MSKLYRKYRTRDLLMLERRGNSGASAELDRRSIIEAARTAHKRAPADDAADMHAFHRQAMAERQRARFNPLPATTPAGATYNTVSRRALTRAMETA